LFGSKDKSWDCPNLGMNPEDEKLDDQEPEDQDDLEEDEEEDSEEESCIII